MKDRDNSGGNIMEGKKRKFFTDDEIRELGIDELSVPVGGIEITVDIDGVELMATNQVKCPKCRQNIPIHSLKEHLKTVHGM